MKTSTLRLVALTAALTACNLSSTVGENEGEGGAGGRESTSTTATQTAAQTTTNVASTTQVTSTTEVASSSREATGTTTGNVTIQGAHVEIAVRNIHGWLDEGLSIQITARDAAPIPMPADAPCAVNDAPVVSPDPEAYLPLDGIEVTASSPAASQALLYSTTDRSAYAWIPGTVPSGTPITLTFAPTSSLWPGESIVVSVNDAFLSSPTLEAVGIGTAIFHPTGADMTIAVTGDPTRYQVAAATTGGTAQSPMTRPVLSCVSAAGASTVIPGAMFTPLITFRDALIDAGQGPSEVWLLVNWRNRQENDVARAGNFLTTESGASLARAVNFE